MRHARLGTVLGLGAAASLLLIATAAPVAAGGWATILIDKATQASTGTAGQPIELTFTVLQHGVTPIDDESPTVVATEAATGDTVGVSATAVGAGGIYHAALVLPHAGRWRWQVRLAQLQAHSQFRDVVVAPAMAVVAGSADAASGTPAIDPVDPLPALVVGLGGGLSAAGLLYLLARAGGRRRQAASTSR